ncbi:hypothetical protein PIB30_010135 [Stylosanthes scabra]|uniref:NB-ARC domain-containing protein n=1 Tax=Stylosanthes scabra TaxID=79078 RepID=A0ABU6Z521_9FABA|nr:hypothetical protein [Stylosanthes scabra]
MATALVVGAFLSATIQTLLDNISSSEFRDYFRSTLHELETTLSKLKDVVLNMEDLLDEIGYDSLRCKVEAATHQDINNQDILNLQSVSRRVSHRTPTSSLVNESAIVGRNDDKEKLVNMLLSDSDNGINGGSNIGVIAILGIGGVGKTTLAQLLYNNEQVQEHFDLKAWVCVSEDFDALRVTKTLPKSTAKISEDHDAENLDFLRVELKQRLRGKKFLFVLDDLWTFRFQHGKIPLDVRHFSCEQEVYDSFEKFEDFYELKSLRSFIPLSPVCLGKTHLSRKVLDDLLPSLKCLRVLSLARYSNITKLPTSIGNLVHLRYLDLSYTEIQHVHCTICRP